MSRVIVQALSLMGIYLLVLTSADPADAVTGFALGLGLALALRRRLPGSRHVPPRPGRLPAFGRVVAMTAAEMVIGTWRTVKFCLWGHGRPGFVEIPRDGRSRHGVALWGVLTGESPDEIPVDIDERRGVLIVHLVDASDPEAVRERHRRTYERAHSKVLP